MRTFLIVIDSFGVGALPDAHKYGDEGSNTFLNTFNASQINLPNMAKLGLYDIDGIKLPHSYRLIGNYARMQELTPAKDTTAGHYEISGIKLKHPYPVYPNAFPQKLVTKLEKVCGIKFIGNVVGSGTQLIDEFGKQSIDTNSAILYTSADSVLQIACHDSVLSLEQLYDVCEKARKVMKGKHNVGRVIARPFAGVEGKFYRTEYRKDYALNPPKPSMLVYLKNKGFDVIGVGKIEDIFCNEGLTQSFHTRSNEEAINKVLELSTIPFNGLVFANYNDTDMLFGHRNNVQGYANALMNIDKSLPTLIANLNNDDVLIVTADHGCDPTTSSTDHSREYTPLLVYGKNLKSGINLGTLVGFDNIAKSLLDYYNIKKYNNSFLRVLSNGNEK